MTYILKGAAAPQEAFAMKNVLKCVGRCCLELLETGEESEEYGKHQGACKGQMLIT